MLDDTRAVAEVEVGIVVDEAEADETEALADVADDGEDDEPDDVESAEIVSRARSQYTSWVIA